MLSKKSDSHCRDQHPHLKQESQNEVAYTDVVDLIGQNNADIKKCQEVLKKKYQLKVNTDKTEYTSI